MEKDAAALRLNMDAARGAFDRLSLCITALAEERPNLALEAWHAAHALFEATYAIGGLSEISESADKRVVAYETKVRKIRTMHARASAATDERNRIVDDAILACVAGNRSKLLSTREKLTPSHAEVVAKLPKEAGATRTKVRDRIMALKAEWRERAKKNLGPDLKESDLQSRSKS